MPIDMADIETGVMGVLRAAPAFAGWKKKGKRVLWRALDGDLHQAVELVRYKAAFENRQLISIGVLVSFPYEREWPVYVPEEVWHKGRLYRRAYLVPGQEAIEHPRGDSGHVLVFTNPDEFQQWLPTLPAEIDAHLAPWLDRYATLQDAWYDYEVPRWRLEKAGLVPPLAR